MGLWHAGIWKEFEGKTSGLQGRPEHFTSSVQRATANREVLAADEDDYYFRPLILRYLDLLITDARK